MVTPTYRNMLSISTLKVKKEELLRLEYRVEALLARIDVLRAELANIETPWEVDAITPVHSARYRK